MLLTHNNKTEIETKKIYSMKPLDIFIVFVLSFIISIMNDVTDLLSSYYLLFEKKNSVHVLCNEWLQYILIISYEWSKYF